VLHVQAQQAGAAQQAGSDVEQEGGDLERTWIRWSRGMIAAATGTAVPAVLTLQSLPLFPLSAVLFPGGLLSLRIFEVRYLDMINKCRKAGAPFGVVSLTQGGEVRHPGVQEAFAQVGTLATIEEFEQPQPGLMMVRAVGLAALFASLPATS
jgi:hypothetical protein